MIIKGKSASHGRYLKTYLVSKRDNDIDPEVFRIRGTATPDNYDLSANEIILSGLLSRGDKNVYHGIINPSINERPLTDEEWHTSIDKLLKGLGYENQKHIGIKHVKDGREHMHLMIDRYSYDLEKLLPDNHNYRTHQNVATELEEEFNHDLTPRKRDYKRLNHHKEILTDLWNNTADGKDFIEQAEAVGYYIGKGLEKRPYKVVTADGKSLDLVRQLQGINTAEVFDRLRYEELKTEAEALKQVTAEKKIASDLAEQEFLRNLEDEQFLSQQEDREKEKKQLAQLEAEVAAATALENQEVTHSKPKKSMEEIKDADVERRIRYEQELRNAQLADIWFKLLDQHQEELKRMSAESAKWVHEQREKAYLEEVNAIRQLDEKKYDSYREAHANDEYKQPTLDVEKEKRIEDAKFSVRALENVYAGQPVPTAHIDALKERFGENILEELSIARQVELNKEAEKQKPFDPEEYRIKMEAQNERFKQDDLAAEKRLEAEKEQQKQKEAQQAQLSEEERKRVEREERRQQMLEAYDNKQDITKGMKY